MAYGGGEEEERFDLEERGRKDSLLLSFSFCYVLRRKCVSLSVRMEKEEKEVVVAGRRRRRRKAAWLSRLGKDRRKERERGR